MVDKVKLVILSIYKENALCWSRFNEQAQLVSTEVFSSFDELPLVEDGEILLVLLPGQDVLLTQVEMPKMRRQELLKALPYAIEDQVVGDIDDHYFFPGSVAEDGMTPVAVIDKGVFDAYNSKLESYGLRPAAILPDFLSLPNEVDSISICIKESSALVRTGLTSGFSVPVENLLPFLELLLHQEGVNKPKQYICSGANEELKAHLSQQANLIEVPIESMLDDTLQGLSFPINLLRRKFKPKVKKSLFKQPWKIAAGSFIALLVVMFAGQVAQYLHSSAQNKKLESKMTATYQKVFPNGSYDEGSKQLLERELHALIEAGKGDQFIHMLGKVGAILQRNQKIVLQSISYQTGVLTLKCQADKLSSLEGFSHALSQQGLHIKKNQISTTDKSVLSTLVIGGK